MKMQKRIATGLVAVGLTFSLCACGVPTTSVLDGNGPGTALPPASSGPETSSNEPEVEQLKTLRSFSQKTVEILPENAYTTDTKIADVIADPVFGDYGRLIFPVDPSYYSGNTLGELELTWYSHIDPNKTVEIANYMRSHASTGETIFYDIYTEEEKAADTAKQDTGLFFFRGKPEARFAVCNAGGGFAYVGAMHDSFPHALELSKKGYNAFALIYRPGAQTACEDLARAISFIFSHAEELQVNTDCYSLWGGSAGGKDGGVSRYLRPGGLWRRRPASSGGGHHPVHRPQRLFGERSTNLRLRRRKRWHRQLADHGTAAGAPVSSWHRHRVPCLPRPGSRLRPGDRDGS